MIKQHRQRAERLQTDDGDGGKADIAPARGAIEHPSRDLEPSLAVRTIDRTAKYRAIRLVDGIVNEDFVTCPRVKAIQDLATSGPVGILKPCSTTSGARIRRLTGARLTRPTSPNRKRRWPHDRRRRFCRSSGRATPSRRDRQRAFWGALAGSWVGATLVGLRPPAAATKSKRPAFSKPRQRSTQNPRGPVQTSGASSFMSHSSSLRAADINITVAFPTNF